MSRLNREAAKWLYKFGSLLKKFLIFNILVLLFSIGVPFIPILPLYITAAILMRILSFVAIYFQYLMVVQLLHTHRDKENKNLLLSIIFLIIIMAFSVMDNTISIIEAFIPESSLGIIAHIALTLTIIFEILFWFYFQRFLLEQNKKYRENLVRPIIAYLIVTFISLVISILYFVPLIVNLIELVLLFIVFIVGITRIVLQFKIANGIMNNFRA